MLRQSLFYDAEEDVRNGRVMPAENTFDALRNLLNGD